MQERLSAEVIENILNSLGGASLAELNEHLPDVADAIYEHDTTGMAEPDIKL